MTNDKTKITDELIKIITEMVTESGRPIQTITAETLIGEELQLKSLDFIRLVSAMGVGPDNLLLELEGQRLPKHNDSKVAALLIEVRKAQRILKIDFASSVRYKPCSETAEIPGIETN